MPNGKCSSKLGPHSSPLPEGEGVCLTNQGPSPGDQSPLIFGQCGRQIVERKPFRGYDFKTAWLRLADGPGAKIDFNLSHAGKRSGKKNFYVFDFYADLFAQLATQASFRLFASSQKTACHSPPVVSTEDVL